MSNHNFWTQSNYILHSCYRLNENELFDFKYINSKMLTFCYDEMDNRVRWATTWKKKLKNIFNVVENRNLLFLKSHKVFIEYVYKRILLSVHGAAYYLTLNSHLQTIWAQTGHHFSSSLGSCSAHTKYLWKKIYVLTLLSCSHFSFHFTRTGHHFNHNCSSSDWVRLWAHQYLQIGHDDTSQFVCLFGRRWNRH